MQTNNKGLLFFLLILTPVISNAANLPINDHTNQLTNNHIFGEVEYIFIIRTIIGFILGCIIGVTHGLDKSAAISVSLKTYGAVALGSALLASVYTHLYFSSGLGNPLQNLGTTITGIGFLCAAVIFKGANFIRGLATASTIWTTAGVGIACGCGLFGLAIIATLILVIFNFIPSQGTKIHREKLDNNKNNN